MSKRIEWRLLLGAACVSLSAGALAAGYPEKPIQVIVPYAPGGTTDQLARMLQKPMSDALGQQVIVINKPGAGGTIGVDQVVRAEPDGYTLVFGNSGPNAIVGLTRKIPYDMVNDLKPISTVALTPMILAVPTDSPAKTLKDFIAYARQHGSKMNFGSVGAGSLSHLTGEYFNDLAGLKLQHVPYTGGAPMLPAFIGGEIQAAFVTGLDGATMLASGKVRYIAVGTEQPTDVAPGLPAIAQDVPGFKSVAWFGLLAPKGTPDDIVKKVHAAVVSAVANPEVNKLFRERWIEPRSSTPQELANIIKGEIGQWRPVVQKANIQN
ncbi:MAG: tripartite tricarboxylate transporter substrate binding protein [Pigmentiphaga sp.]|uniref:Bug family tripartite tricarboxylate transporter substrate binding protein n=1 Tax=Pigmentiphaga sp. TaxID=1977564 RepID=UPI0029B4B483|nr:tripartite tricarboxylate transporter substrate binding protein [Pigmentiphaga sp.]MDX3906794.1 tripartite tricarboxylate transporter substrate binding protein [Pigmentiphaga sp.]